MKRTMSERIYRVPNVLCPDGVNRTIVVFSRNPLEKRNGYVRVDGQKIYGVVERYYGEYCFIPHEINHDDLPQEWV